MRVDLHTHSTASDGSLSPSELVDLAYALGLDALALTDHDTVEGLPEARARAAHVGLRLVDGVELSTVHDGRDVHILGYHFDAEDPKFRTRLARLREARLQRAHRIVENLREAGYLLAIDDVLVLAQGGAVGRSHVARALVEKGHARDIADAFERFIGRDRPFYLAKPVEDPSCVIGTILDAGGVAVLAHPGVGGIDDALSSLVNAGLQGLEAYHPEHTLEMRSRYAALASDLGLVVTGGSDFHGHHTPGAALGSIDIPADVLDRLDDVRRGPFHAR